MAPVLRAMARALEQTENAFMEMLEKVLDKNPVTCFDGFMCFSDVNEGSRCVCHEP